MGGWSLTNDTTRGIRVKLNSWGGDRINVEKAMDKIGMEDFVASEIIPIYVLGEMMKFPNV